MIEMKKTSGLSPDFFTHKGCQYKIGNVYPDAQLQRNGSYWSVVMPGRLHGKILGHFESGGRIPVRLKDFVLLPTGIYRPTFEPVTQNEVQPSPATDPMPRHGPPPDPLLSEIEALPGRIAGAQTPAELANVGKRAVKLQREARGPAAEKMKEKEPVRQWLAKATDEIEFYQDAAKIRWTQAGIAQYADMCEIAKQVDSLLRLTGQPSKQYQVLKYPGEEDVQLSQLPLAQVSRKEVEERRRIESAKKAGTALQNNPFRRRGMDALVDACQAKEDAPQLIEWLRYITSDVQIFLKHYPNWSVLVNELMAYFRARLEPPKS
jgi:hypothetical protein